MKTTTNTILQIRAILAYLFPKDLTPKKWEGDLPWADPIYLDSPDYVQVCDLSFENVWSRVDEFLPCHFLGWVAKGMMLRSYTLAWIMSVFWELTELFYIPIMANFEECWWDQWVFDIILCNGFGIFIGMQVLLL